MFGKTKLASGLLGVLTVFCLFLFAIEALDFRALAATRSGVDDLSNVAIAQVDAASTARGVRDERGAPSFADAGYETAGSAA